MPPIISPDLDCVFRTSACNHPKEQVWSKNLLKSMKYFSVFSKTFADSFPRLKERARTEGKTSRTCGMVSESCVSEVVSRRFRSMWTTRCVCCAQARPSDQDASGLGCQVAIPSVSQIFREGHQIAIVAKLDGTSQRTPHGRVGEIVIGDIFRRSVVRTITQRLSNCCDEARTHASLKWRTTQIM